MCSITLSFFARRVNGCMKALQSINPTRLSKKLKKNDSRYLEEAPRKIVFPHNCVSIPLYENQEGSTRGYAEREGYWDIQTTISSPESAVLILVTPISSILASELSSGTQNSINPMVDLATPETTPVSAFYAAKKRKIEVKHF